MNSKLSGSNLISELVTDKEHPDYALYFHDVICIDDAQWMNHSERGPACHVSIFNNNWLS